MRRMVILVSEKCQDLRKKGVVMTTAENLKRPCRLLSNELRPKKRMSIVKRDMKPKKSFSDRRSNRSNQGCRCDGNDRRRRKAKKATENQEEGS